MKRIREVFETTVLIGCSTERPYLAEREKKELAVYLSNPAWKGGERVRVTVEYPAPRPPRRVKLKLLKEPDNFGGGQKT